MSGSKIKTMVIAALVLVNIVFLAVIAVSAAGDARTQREAIENACAILRRNGIEVYPDDISSSGAIRTMKTARNDGAEAAIARALLGTTFMTDQGGIIYLYENPERGEAEFFSAGDFKIRLNPGVIANSGSALKTVRKLLRRMKLETSELVLAGEPGAETVTTTASYKGASIFNCAIEFFFNGSGLETVEGRYVADIEVAEESPELSSAGTALLYILAETVSGNIECERIYSVESGYRHRMAGSTDSFIAPAWLITADSGRYIIDDATGETMRLSEN